MDNTRSVRLEGDERAEFLGTGGTGVASFPTGSDGPPYSLPVSYGYDAEEETFYLRLAFGPGTEKDGVVTDGSPVSLVVYNRDGGGWRSVVVTGRLEEAAPEVIGSDVLEAMHRIHIPLVDVFERHPRELTFRFFTIVADEVTGRREAQRAD